MTEMVTSLISGIVMANGGCVECDIPNTNKRLKIMVEEKELTDDEKMEVIGSFLMDEIGIEQTEPDFSEPCVCLKLDEFLKLKEKYEFWKNESYLRGYNGEDDWE